MCLVHVLSLLVLPTCVTICYIARGLIVLYVLMFGAVCKPTYTMCDDFFLLPGLVYYLKY